jgi:hypothetical protein
MVVKYYIFKFYESLSAALLNAFLQYFTNIVERVVYKILDIFLSV